MIFTCFTISTISNERKKNSIDLITKTHSKSDTKEAIHNII